MVKNILNISHLTTEYKTSGGYFPVINDLSLTIEESQAIAVVGESGCGKSALAKSILGILPRKVGRIRQGQIELGGIDLTLKDSKQMSEIRGSHISMIFQEPMSALNPLLTIGEQIGETLRRHSNITIEGAKSKTIEWLGRVGIRNPEELYFAYPHKFSGGMRQRVLIAMALICGPQLLIADEPTTALDVTVQAQIMGLIGELRRKLRMSLLLITHDLGVVANNVDKVAVMYTGRIVEIGSTEDIFVRAAHPYTIGLLRSIYDWRAKDNEKVARKGWRLPEIPGVVPNLRELPPGCSFADRCPWADTACRAAVPAFVQIGPGHYAACVHTDRGRGCVQ